MLNKSEKDYFGLNNVEIIPNFIKNEILFENKEKKNIIITAGRISREKQFYHLVEIWSRIASKNPNWEFHLYGSGSTEQLYKLIKEHKIEGAFRIFPATNDIKNRMKEASIFALVSATEAFPIVLLEALQAELPIVSYDSPHGPKHIVTNEVDGYIVPLNDKIAFSEKLDTLINDSKLRADFVANQKSKLELFSKEKVMKQWNDLVFELITK